MVTLKYNFCIIFEKSIYFSIDIFINSQFYIVIIMANRDLVIEEDDYSSYAWKVLLTNNEGKSLSSSESGAMGKFESVDSTGLNQLHGLFGESLATDLRNDVGVQFQYNLSTYDVTATVANDGTASQADNMVVLSTGTAANGSVIVQSVDSLR